MSGTTKTERRRSRSRSRQRIDSELVRRVDEIPLVHDTMEYIISTYGVIKVCIERLESVNPACVLNVSRSSLTGFESSDERDPPEV